MHRESGFTLLEVLITVAVLAVLTALAVPSFTNLIERNKARSVANDLLASILLARSEAIKRERNTALTRAGNGQDWTHWQTFVDNDNSRTYNSGDELLLDNQVDAANLSITATGSPIGNSTTAGLFFDSRGFPPPTLSPSTPAYFTITAGDTSYYICLSPTGRPRFSKEVCQ